MPERGDNTDDDAFGRNSNDADAMASLRRMHNVILPAFSLELFKMSVRIYAHDDIFSQNDSVYSESSRVHIFIWNTISHFGVWKGKPSVGLSTCRHRRHRPHCVTEM